MWVLSHASVVANGEQICPLAQNPSALTAALESGNVYFVTDSPDAGVRVEWSI